MRWSVVLVLLVVACSARAPSVSRSNLEKVPQEWHQTWESAQQEVEQAKQDHAQARAAEDDPRRLAHERQSEVERAQSALSSADKEHKQARRDSDPHALRSAVEARSRAKAELAEAQERARVAQAKLDYAKATTALRAAELRVAAAELELIKAQAAIDAGAYLEIEPFAQELAEAEAAVIDAVEAERRAEAAIVLAGQ